MALSSAPVGQKQIIRGRTTISALFSNPRLFFFLILLIGTSGCARSAKTPAKTDGGAENVARTFFEALANEEWSAAYDALDPDSRAWCGKDEFIDRAQKNMVQMGFKPTAVRVSVTESDDTASAVALFRKMSGTNQQQHKDGASLRRLSKGWVIVLRKNFGIDSNKKAGGKN